MKIIHSFEELKAIKENIVFALGTFDGIHIGHQAVISLALKKAQASHSKTVVVTFDEHPFAIVAPEKKPQALAQRGMIHDILASMGIDYVLSFPMTKELVALEAEDFLKKLCENHNVLGMVVGENYTFGAKGKGNPSLLQDYFKDSSTEVIVATLTYGDNSLPISSTMIRKAVAQGHMEEVHQLLGRPYSFTGTVIKGDQRGRTLGFPTLNFLFPEHMITPPDGVYANRVCINGTWYNGVGNIGDNPTFTNQYHRCEVHVFDFDEDVYGLDVTVEFISFLRGEMKFNSLESLVHQLHNDQVQALEILKNYK